MKLVSHLMINCLIYSLVYSAHYFPKDTSVQEHLDIPYHVSKDKHRRLNLILPKEEGSPLFIWIGGGAWSYVDRSKEMDFARKVAGKGITVASVGHRLSNPLWRDSTLEIGHQHPVHIEDLADAVRWLYDHAGEYGYNRNEMIIGGFSSGAHLATLLCTNPRYLNTVGLQCDMFVGLVAVSGTYDIFDYHKTFLESANPTMAESHVEAIFGQPGKIFRDASPVYHLENLRTPILVISDSDLYNYSRLFEDRLRESNHQETDVMHVKHLGHSALWRNLSFSETSAYRNLIVDFIFRESGRLD